MTSVLVGIVFVLAGCWGIITWFQDLVAVARGLAPVSILVGGVIAIIAGVASLRSQRRNEASKS